MDTFNQKSLASKVFTPIKKLCLSPKSQNFSENSANKGIFTFKQIKKSCLKKFATDKKQTQRVTFGKDQIINFQKNSKKNISSNVITLRGIKNEKIAQKTQNFFSSSRQIDYEIEIILDDDSPPKSSKNPTKILKSNLKSLSMTEKIERSAKFSSSSSSFNETLKRINSSSSNTLQASPILSNFDVVTNFEGILDQTEEKSIRFFLFKARGLDWENSVWISENQVDPLYLEDFIKNKNREIISLYQVWKVEYQTVCSIQYMKFLSCLWNIKSS